MTGAQAPQFLLASGSPRRREILAMLGYRFECRPAHADESLPRGISPEEAVRLLARRKASADASAGAHLPVLAADTVVALDGVLLGKPVDGADARRMLRLLSGRTHEVYTGVCLSAGGRVAELAQCTRVTFYPLSEELIDRYAASGEPLDKAGAYGIQGRGSVLVARIEGDYYNVVGLPAAETVRLLASAGIFPDWS